MTPLMLGTKEAAAVLGISRICLWKWQKKGLVSPPKSIGQRRLFDMKKLIGEVQKNQLACDPLAFELFAASEK